MALSDDIYAKIAAKRAEWDASVAAALASKSEAHDTIMAMDQDWQVISTHTGTTPPTAPDEENYPYQNAGPFCGVSYRTGLEMGNGYMYYRAFFKGEEYWYTFRRSYRVVEKTPYVQYNEWERVFESTLYPDVFEPTGNECADWSAQQAYADWAQCRNRCREAASALPSTYPGSATANDIRQASDAIINGMLTGDTLSYNYVPNGNCTYGYPFTITRTFSHTSWQGSETIQQGTITYSPTMGGSFHYIRSEGHDGTWDIEMKQEIIGLETWPTDPFICREDELFIPNPNGGRGGPGPGPNTGPRPNPGGGAGGGSGGPKPPKNPNYPRPTGTGGSGGDWTTPPTIINIGNTCTTTLVTAPNIFDFDLTQLDMPPGYTIEGAWVEPITTSFTIPGANFLTQVGNTFLGYNTAKGALVWDIQLKKWGKFKADYNFLVDHQAANIPAYQQFNYTDLGLTAGTWLNGVMSLFDDRPTEGFIKYGKIGYYRLGMIHLLETRIDFRRPALSTITIEASLDGRLIDPSYSLAVTINNTNTVTMYPNNRYRWYSIKIEGQYDLQYMEVRANHIAARR